MDEGKFFSVINIMLEEGRWKLNFFARNTITGSIIIQTICIPAKVIL